MEPRDPPPARKAFECECSDLFGILETSETVVRNGVIRKKRRK